MTHRQQLISTLLLPLYHELLSATEDRRFLRLLQFNSRQVQNNTSRPCKADVFPPCPQLHPPPSVLEAHSLPSPSDLHTPRCSGRLHAWQSVGSPSPQAVLQHTPSTQKPVSQFIGSVQSAPIISRLWYSQVSLRYSHASALMRPPKSNTLLPDVAIGISLRALGFISGSLCLQFVPSQSQVSSL